MLHLTGSHLTLTDVWRVVYDCVPVALSNDARDRMEKSRAVVDAWTAREAVIYGVTTGFGDFATVHIAGDKLAELQRNLIISHSAGTGDPLPPAIVRGMLLLRANALAKGLSGARVSLVEHLLAMLNADIISVVPSQGSVGSSGDLVPLAHLALAAMGEGEVWVLNDEHHDRYELLNRTDLPRRPVMAAFDEARITPVVLAAKEGLALINGTQMMTAFGALAVMEAKRLARVADVSGAMSCEAQMGSDTPFDARIHAARPMPGQQVVAANLRMMMENSGIRESHRHISHDPRVQDPYSLRCMPQVHGASRDAIGYADQVVSIELNSATDNPLIFADDEAHLEGGNFHGQPIAIAMDLLAIALAELASISERRTDKLVNGSSRHLPKFLTRHGGLHSGLMIAQYTSAALVSENKVLAHPASVDSITTSAGQEDHNSMGSIAARKCYTVMKNVKRVLAIELMCAAQALDFVRPLEGGKGTRVAYEIIRAAVPHLDTDRVIAEDIASIEMLLATNALPDAARVN
jgi:histidine ammonia-lyase